MSNDGHVGELTVFVRGVGDYHPALPEIDEDLLRPVAHISGLRTLPSDEHRGLQRFVADKHMNELWRFDATCQEISFHCECSRQFQYLGLVGGYSFECGEIVKWREFDISLFSAISDGRISLCKNNRS